MKVKALLLGVALAGTFASASALTVQNGNILQSDSIVVRDPCGLTPSSASGSIVFGCLDNNHGQIVRLVSDESLEISGDPATLDATDGTFSRLTISLDGNTLSTVILNIDATEDGFVSFADGASMTGLFALAGDGDNFFTITGISSVSGGFLTFITSDGLRAELDIVADVTQIRLGTVGAIPEAETYALMMAGLAAIGFIARRRSKTRT